MSRKYSVQEIDDLRRAVENKYLWGTYGLRRGGMSRSYNETEKYKAVEEMVRTHMLAGHTADDLRASERNLYPDGFAGMPPERQPS